MLVWPFMPYANLELVENVEHANTKASAAKCSLRNLLGEDLGLLDPLVRADWIGNLSSCFSGG